MKQFETNNPNWALQLILIFVANSIGGRIKLGFRELFRHFHYAPNKLGCSPSIRWLHGELTCHKFTLWGWWQGWSQSSWKNKKMALGSHPPTPWALFQPQLSLYPQYWSTPAPHLSICLCSCHLCLSRSLSLSSFLSLSHPLFSPWVSR